MTIKTFLTASVAMFAMTSAFRISAQPVNLKFSDEIITIGKDQFYAREIIGESEKHIYALMGNNSLSTNKATQLQLESIGKSNLKTFRKVNLYQSKRERKRYAYLDAYSRDGEIVVFFEDKNKGSVTIYVSIYDEDLDLKTSFHQLYNYNKQDEAVSLKFDPRSADIIVLSQPYVEEGQPIQVMYTTFNQKLKKVHSAIVDLELLSKVSKKRARRKDQHSLNVLQLTRTGDLVGKFYISSDEKTGEIGYYELRIINTTTGETIAHPLKLGNEMMFDDANIIMLDDEIIIAGFYSESIFKERRIKKEDRIIKSSDIEGTFFFRFGIEDRKLKAQSQFSFSSELIKQVAATNLRVSNGLFSKANKVKKNSQNNFEVDGNYRIQYITFDQENELANFYCEFVKNTVSKHTTRHSNGTTTTTETYHSERGNIFYFQISLEKGTMNWYETISKYEAFNSPFSSVWHINTMYVLPRTKGDLLVYSTDYTFEDTPSGDPIPKVFEDALFAFPYVTAEINDLNGAHQITVPNREGETLERYEQMQLEDAYRSLDGSSYYTLNTKYKIRPGPLLVSYLIPNIIEYPLKLNPKRLHKQTYTMSQLSY